MKKYKIKIKHLNDAPLKPFEQFDSYKTKKECLDVAVEMVRLGYYVKCYKLFKEAKVYYEFKSFDALV